MSGLAMGARHWPLLVGVVALLWLSLLGALAVTAQGQEANPRFAGLYDVIERSLGGPSCPAPPLRVLTTETSGPANDPRFHYRVLITVSGDSISFHAATGGDALFTATLKPPEQQPPPPAQSFLGEFTDAQGIVGQGEISFYGPESTFNLWWYYSCNISASGQYVGRGGTEPALPGAGAGPSGIPVDIVLGVGAGGLVVTVITIGGWRWRNRRAKPLTDPNERLAPKVPPRCRDVASRHDRELEILKGLREAVTELQKKLDRAETIHKNNLIKARMVINLEIIQAVGGFTTDLVVALRPQVLRKVAPGAIGEQDGWRPPGTMTAKLADRIQELERVIRDAWGKFQRVANQVETLKGTVQKALEELPAVKNARQLWAFHMNGLGEMVSDLSKATQLRSKLAKLEQAAEGLRTQRSTLRSAMGPLEGRLSELESRLNLANNQIAVRQGLVPKDLKAAEDALTSMQAKGIEDTARLARAQNKIDALRGQLDRIGSDPAVRQALDEVRTLQIQIAEARQALEPLKRDFNKVGRQLEKNVAGHQRLNGQLLTQLNDLKPADLEKQAKIVEQAQRELDQAVAQGTAQVGRELAEREAELKRLENGARYAEELLKDVRIQAAREDTWNRKAGAAAGKVVKGLTFPIRYPIGLIVEGWVWAFGLSQSPQEIVNVLLRGQKNIRILRGYVTELERRIFLQEQLVERLRVRVDACVKGVELSAAGPSMPMPAPETPVATRSGG